MIRHSNIQPLNLCVYRYPDNLELKLQKRSRQLSSLPQITAKRSLKKSKLFSFSSFIPLESPFVLNMVRLLVNAIEKNSHSNGKWGPNSMQVAQVPDMDNIVKGIMFSSVIEGEMIIAEFIQVRRVEFILLLLRKILKQFYPRLIHFLNTDLLPVTSSPLYDSTMRPNPKFNSVVRHAVLRSSRTIIDTAAFVMIHLFHCWEYSMNMQEAKKGIVQNFGKLLVSFECTPKLIDRSDLSPESCLLGIILETTNVPFWNSLTGHRIFEAFNVTKLVEFKMSRKVPKCKMFPQIPEIMKYDLPHLKMPIHYFFKSINPNYTIESESNTISTFTDEEQDTSME